MKPICGSDLDNTYDTHPEIHGEVDFIVTGNSWDKADEIMDTEDINKPVFWNPGKEELMDIVAHKANIINKTGAVKFFEDQEIQVNLLKTMCPHARIIQVKDNLNSII